MPAEEFQKLVFPWAQLHFIPAEPNTSAYHINEKISRLNRPSFLLLD
jgi:hypothetical protein